MIGRSTADMSASSRVLDGRLSVQGTELKRDWSLTEEAFHRLLQWLDEGTSSEGQTYLEMRRRLVAYFDRKDCAVPEELTDETMNRVARRLVEAGAIESETPARYCYITARFVFLEYVRARAKDQQMRSELPREAPGGRADEHDGHRRERMLDCLEHCANELDPGNRDLILRYYFGEERVKIDNRRALASALGITVNALSIRACRVRERLERCVRERLGPK